jgi:hypothetical protein
VWLTQTEAAARLGWHVDKLRAAAKRGKFQRRKGNHGQWLVMVPQAALGGDSSSGWSALGTALGSDSGNVQAAPGTALSGGPDSATAAYGTHDELGELVAELREELAEERLARARVKERLVARDALIEELRTALDRETVRADRYEAELAHLRRPLWERLIEALRRRS